MADVIIQFGKSSSKQYRNVVTKAKQFPFYREENELHVIELSFLQIIVDWEKFHEIFIIIAKWSSFRMDVKAEIFNQKNAFKFYYKMQDIKNCYKNYLRFKNIDRYCNDTAWKCVHINSIKTKPNDYGTFWYSFGHFNRNFTQWHVHKDEVKQMILHEIEKKGLEACPMFSFDRVLSVLDVFPDVIELKNNPDWKIVTEKKFIGSRIEDIPSGIEHVIPEDQRPHHQTGFGIVIDATALLNSMTEEGNVEPENKIDPSINPFMPGSNDWANWEIENYERKKSGK